jgi:hypothetical protein
VDPKAMMVAILMMQTPNPEIRNNFQNMAILSIKE